MADHEEIQGAEVYDLPLSPEVLTAKLNKLVRLTHILERDGESLWDKVVLIQKTTGALIKAEEKTQEVLNEVLGQQKALLKSHATLTDHVLKIRSPLSRAQAGVYTMAGAALGGGVAALVFQAVLHYFK